MIKQIRRTIYNISKKVGDKVGIDLPYYVENGFWVMFGYFFSMLSGVAISIAFTRLTSKELYGQYSFILSILSMVSLVSLPGFGLAVARSVAMGYDGAYVKGTKYRFKWSFLGIIILWSIASYYYVENNIKIAILLIISSVFFVFLYAPNLWTSFLSGKSEFSKLTQNRNLENIVSSILLVTSIFFWHDNLFVIILVYLSSKVFFNILFYKKYLKSVSNHNVDKEMVQYGWFMSKMNALGVVISYFDKIIIGIYDIELLAIYTIAGGLLEMIKNFIKSSSSIILPRFIDKGKTFTIKQLIIFLSLGVILTILIYNLSYPIIHFLYSVEYNKSVYVLKLLSGVASFYIINSMLGWKYIAQNTQNIIFLLNVVSRIAAIIIPIIIYIIFNEFIYFFIAKYYTLIIFDFIFLISHYGNSRRKSKY